MEWYKINKIHLMDYDGHKQEVPLDLLLPIFRRTENRPKRFIEDKWLKWCNKMYDHEWTNIKFEVSYI